MLGWGIFLGHVVTAIETPLFILITRSDICQNATDDAGIVRMGTLTTESHRDLSMHPSAFQQTSSTFQEESPTLLFFCFFLNGSRALPVLGPQHPKPLPQVWTHEWVTNKDQKEEDSRDMHYMSAPNPTWFDTGQGPEK